MPDGAIKSASVESETGAGEGAGEPVFNIAGKTAIGVMALNLWMLLMTAIYFHTWFEKVGLAISCWCMCYDRLTLLSQLTGLLTAIIGVYAIYYVPRFVPALRGVIGLPGI